MTLVFDLRILVFSGQFWIFDSSGWFCTPVTDFGFWTLVTDFKFWMLVANFGFWTLVANLDFGLYWQILDFNVTDGFGILDTSVNSE